MIRRATEEDLRARQRETIAALGLAHDRFIESLHAALSAGVSMDRLAEIVGPLTVLDLCRPLSGDDGE